MVLYRSKTATSEGLLTVLMETLALCLSIAWAMDMDEKAKDEIALAHLPSHTTKLVGKGVFPFRQLANCVR